MSNLSTSSDRTQECIEIVMLVEQVGSALLTELPETVSDIKSRIVRRYAALLDTVCQGTHGNPEQTELELRVFREKMVTAAGGEEAFRAIFSLTA